MTLDNSNPEIETAVDLYEYVDHEKRDFVIRDGVNEESNPEESARDAALASENEGVQISTNQESDGNDLKTERAHRTTRESIHSIRKTVIHSADSLHDLEQFIPFYAAPMQRQKWNEPQVLPHINWGDLFFDLFFVAAAYNLGAFLISVVDDGTPNVWPRGFLYYVGMFGSLILVWTKKMSYDSRYTVVDYSHRVFETIRVCFVALAIMHIEGLEVMQDPKKVNTFNFILGLTLEQLTTLVMQAEIMFNAVGTSACRIEARRLLIVQQCPHFVIYFAALIIAGKDHYSAIRLNYDNKHFRQLAAAEDSYSALNGYKFSQDDVPYLIIFIGFIIIQLAMYFYVTCFLPGDGKHKQVSTPMNVDFATHRYGEWTMLMLGESVLSLLIVGIVDTRDYYVVAFVGIVTVILLQALHFESEPSHADGHAMRRDKSAGIFFYYCIQLYSMALVAVGASYKVMLQIIYYSFNHSESSTYGDSSYGDNSYTPVSNDTASGNSSVASVSDEKHRLLYHRFLAESAINDSYEVKQITSNLFSIALMIALIALELMTFSHKGLEYNYQRCVTAGDSEHSWRRAVSFLYVFLKLAFVVATGTLSIWVVEPYAIAVAGLIIVLIEIILRVVGWELFNKNKGYCSLKSGKCKLRKLQMNRKQVEAP